MSDKCKCEHTQHDCTLAENCRVVLMCKRVIESETVTVDRAEYEAMKADSERLRACIDLINDLANVANDCLPDHIPNTMSGKFTMEASFDFCSRLSHKIKISREFTAFSIDQARKI